MENQIGTLLAGKWELAIGNMLIPASLLGDISPNYEEGIVEAETQAGKRSQPSGKADTAELTFTLFIETMDTLKAVFADMYNQPTAEAQKSGNIVFGGGTCSTRTPLPINIHPVCEKTDDNDIHIYGGLVKATFNPTLSTSDAASVEVTVAMQPTEEGYMRIGTGDLSQPSYWDTTTQSTKPLQNTASAQAKVAKQN